MLAIFFFHCARFFDTEGWHLKNAQQSFVVDTLRIGFIWTWVMELFFLLAGVGAYYALKSRTAGAYLAERAKRQEASAPWLCSGALRSSSWSSRR